MLEQTKGLPTAFQAPIDARIIELKGLLQASKPVETRHSIASRRLARAKQELDQRLVAVDTKNKIQELQSTLAERLALKAAMEASIMVLQTEFAATAKEAAGAEPDRSKAMEHKLATVDNEIASQTGVDPGHLKRYFEK